MNAPIIRWGKPGFDLRALAVGMVGIDGAAKELPDVDSNPLPSVTDLPDLDTGFDMLIDQLISLQPRDYEVPLKSLHIDPATGFLMGEKKKPIAYTPTAITHLCGFWNSQLSLLNKLPRSPGANLLYYRPSARADMVEDIRGRLKADRPVTVRLICPNGKPILRAITSEKHTLDNGDLLGLTRKLFDTLKMSTQHGTPAGLDDARLHASWAWDTATLTVYFGTNQTGARGVARITLSETKCHAWNALAGVDIGGRTYWGWQPAEHAHGRHVGVKVADRMVNAVLAAHAMRDQIVAALEQASAMQMDEVNFARLTRKYALPDVGFSPVGLNLRQLLDAMFDIENKGTQIDADTRRQLRFGLGRILQTLGERGVVGVES